MTDGTQCDMTDHLSPHFSAREFHRGRGWFDGTSRPRYERLARRSLEPLRAALGGRPVTITSGERSPDYNRRVGGAPSSRHLPPAARALASLRTEFSAAADIRVAGVAPKVVAETALRLMREGKMAPGGVGTYETFVHIDSRGRIAEWTG